MNTRYYMYIYTLYIVSQVSHVRIYVRTLLQLTGFYFARFLREDLANSMRGVSVGGYTYTIKNMFFLINFKRLLDKYIEQELCMYLYFFRFDSGFNGLGCFPSGQRWKTFSSKLSLWHWACGSLQLLSVVKQYIQVNF